MTVLQERPFLTREPQVCNPTCAAQRWCFAAEFLKRAPPCHRCRRQKNKEMLFRCPNPSPLFLRIRASSISLHQPHSSHSGVAGQVDVVGFTESWFYHFLATYRRLERGMGLLQVFFHIGTSVEIRTKFHDTLRKRGFWRKLHSLLVYCTGRYCHLHFGRLFGVDMAMLSTGNALYFSLGSFPHRCTCKYGLLLGSPVVLAVLTWHLGVPRTGGGG